MRQRLIAAALALAATAFASPAAVRAETVTSAQQDAVVAVHARTFDGWNDGDMGGVYDRLFAPSLKQRVAKSEWLAVHAQLKGDAGRVVDWRFPKITWYDLSRQLGRDGLAAAIDFAGETQFTDDAGRLRKKFLCGYVIWEQFNVDIHQILRFEFGVFDPAVAAGLSKDQTNQLLAELKCPFRV